MEKIKNQLDTGTSQIENVLTGLLNVTQALSKDPQYITFYFTEDDYSQIPISTRTQLRDIFHSLMFPYELVTDAALQFDRNAAITQNAVFFEGSARYYPNFFCVDNLEFSQWVELLAQNQPGFLPVSRVTTYNNEYDALIYSTRWMKSTYLYACIDIKDIKTLMFEDKASDGHYITLQTTDGQLLYSDLPGNLKKYQTLSNQTSLGNLKIDIYIDNNLFFRKMQPLYLFLITYGCICLAVLILTILTGTHISSKPILDIIDTLESSKYIPAYDAETAASSHKKEADKKRRFANVFYKSFDYISDRIFTANQHLGEYQNTIHIQHKVLQARFIEKAINGHLSSPQELAQFRSYFPDFPQRYSLLLLQLHCYGEEPPYSAPMAILQSFLQEELPHAYHQMLNDTELLLLIEEADFENYCRKLDFLVNNINREEPSYIIRCMASRIFQDLENLPIAYRQLRDMDTMTSPESWYRVCTVDDCHNSSGVPVIMPELMLLYTAINGGNREMALNLLQTYSDKLKATSSDAQFQSVCEVIGMILKYIKLEHPTQLIDEYIPDHHFPKHQQMELYPLFAQLISDFCDKLSVNTSEDISPLAQELLRYIDANYADCDLCFDSLETRFKCSASTIRKAFKKATDTTVSAYIEQKRMKLANELLAQKQKTIAEIAVECGFTNPNSFYKAYKRKYGHAPTLLQTKQK